VGGVPEAVPNMNLTHRKQIVGETQIGHGMRTYTLIFDKRGVVIDVLYNEQGRHVGTPHSLCSRSKCRRTWKSTLVRQADEYPASPTGEA
jgi:hypothetical protein